MPCCLKARHRFLRLLWGCSCARVDRAWSGLHAGHRRGIEVWNRLVRAVFWSLWFFGVTCGFRVAKGLPRVFMLALSGI